MHIAVWGCGYLGTTHAAAMAELGATQVTGVETHPTRLAALQRGQVPFHEPGLAELLTCHLDSGVLHFTDDIIEAVSADIHFLCVGTPQQLDSPLCDLSQIDAAVTSICSVLQPGSIVVGKSTVPVGTAERLQPSITAAGGHLVWNPEFLREGTAVADSLRPDRVVIGSAQPGDSASRTVAALYPTTEGGDIPVVWCDLATAELVKTAANTFLAMKISFVNALSELCDATGGDVVTLADALGLDSRIGRRFLNAGIGFGGGCLPKDLRAFGARATELDVSELGELTDVVDRINQRARRRAVDKVIAGLHRGGLTVSEATVVMLGASFKPDSDDVRDSSALVVADHLTAAGAVVRVVDPVATSDSQTIGDDVDEALSGADVVVLATEWAPYVALDPVKAARLMRHRIAVDGRNMWNPTQWRDTGFDFTGMGRN